MHACDVDRPCPALPCPLLPAQPSQNLSKMQLATANGSAHTSSSRLLTLPPAQPPQKALPSPPRPLLMPPTLALAIPFPLALALQQPPPLLRSPVPRLILPLGPPAPALQEDDAGEGDGAEEVGGGELQQRGAQGEREVARGEARGDVGGEAQDVCCSLADVR